MITGVAFVEKRTDIERQYLKRNTIEGKYGQPKIGSLSFQEHLNEMVTLEKTENSGKNGLYF